ncbi:MAG: ImmA/IrrE family metallo-endopeptidase [Vulcanimicrobiota bacterium]
MLLTTARKREIEATVEALQARHGDPSAIPATYLEEVVRAVGYQLVDADLPAGVAGCCYPRSQRILLNRDLGSILTYDRAPQFRLATLAHELGHAVLHEQLILTGQAPAAVIEPEAQHFAAAFLVPRHLVLARPEGAQLLRARRARFRWSSGRVWRSVHRLAEVFQVTSTLMAWRLAELGVVDACEKRPCRLVLAVC